MAVALSPNELERTIEVLSSAGQTLQLTRFERLSYRALLFSVDGVLATFVVIILFTLFGGRFISGDAKENVHVALGCVLWLFEFVGIVALALNIPLLRRTFREEKRLKRLGLSSLSKSLWKESRQSRWISRSREVLLVASLAFMIGITGRAVMWGRALYVVLILALLYAIIAVLLFVARYLRNQRERMDLAANAEELRKALASLRQREGSEVVSVPAELLEQTAKIEAAQITKERKDAVLQSTAFRPTAYAIAFNREAARQRATLGVMDRVELEDLVAELGTKGALLESQAQLEAIPGTLAGATKSKRVEIEYGIDHASRSIRVIAVRHGAEASDASLNGAGHA